MHFCCCLRPRQFIAELPCQFSHPLSKLGPCGQPSAVSNTLIMHTVYVIHWQNCPLNFLFILFFLFICLFIFSCAWVEEFLLFLKINKPSKNPLGLPKNAVSQSWNKAVWLISKELNLLNAWGTCGFHRRPVLCNKTRHNGKKKKRQWQICCLTFTFTFKHTLAQIIFT